MTLLRGPGLQATRYFDSRFGHFYKEFADLTVTRLQEEPYKMSLFGKDPDYLEVAAADFLPEGDKLFIMVADTDCNLHVLQYDPEGKFPSWRQKKKKRMGRDKTY